MAVILKGCNISTVIHNSQEVCLFSVSSINEVTETSKLVVIDVL